MASRLSSSSASLEIELTKVGEKLLHLPSSTKDIFKILVRTEDILSRLPQSASIKMIKPLQPVIKALIAEGLVRHSNMVVKISVAYCICEIMRITALDTPYNDNQMKEFFELVVTAFEQVSSSSAECYTRMIKVLIAFSSGKFVVMMCELQLEGLIVRLFKRFLTVADSSSSAVVSKMEKIMTMIMKESKEVPRELVNLLAMKGKSNKEIDAPVCTQLAKKVLKTYADQLNSDIPDMTVRSCQHSESETKSLAIDETPMQSKSVTTGKRKKQIQSAEHGEDLVGRRIKVWWPADKTYYEGTVKSFESRKKKHKVWYDDGDKELIDLKTQKWELVEDVSPMLDSESQLVQAVPRDVSSNQSGVICAHGYKVKNVNTPILEAILNKHGDIAATCVFPDAALRTSFLDAVCQIVGQIETNDVIFQMEEIESQLSAAEAAKINVSWLRSSLNAVHKKNEAGKNVTLLMEMKTNILLAKRAASCDLVAAENQLVEAKRRVEALKLVEKKIQSAEHGEDLVGRRIKVWWPADKTYYEGTVKSFESRKKKHKVWYDDGDIELIDLKTQKWELVEDASPMLDCESQLVQAVPRDVSSNQSGVICTHGYKVKNVNAPILEAILNKHGDIAATCVFPDAALRTSLLDAVCQIVGRIETNDVIYQMEEIESQLSAAEAAKMNVSWLRASLNAIHKKNEAGKSVTLLMEMKTNILLAKRAASCDLVAAENQLAEAKRRVEALKLVEKKVNGNFLESKAERDLWAGHPVI